MKQISDTRLNSMLKKLRQLDAWTWAGLAVIALFVFFRLWRLNLPGETVFDEVYFPKMAAQYLAHQSFFDIHPPLGKLMIAVAESIFGNTTVGWRIVPALFGIITIPVAYWVSNVLFEDRRAALATSLLIAIDGLFIVYSRTGLMDGFLILFGLVSVGFGWQFNKLRLAGETEQDWIYLLLSGLFAGLALAIKWIGAGFLPLVAATTFLTMFFVRKKPITFRDFLIWLVSFVVLPTVLYTLPFLANWQSDFWHQFGLWHQQSWGYNVHLNATHPYASKWWGWPFLIRPIWFYYKNDVSGHILGVDAIGNPIVWWGSTLAVIYTILVLVYSALVWKLPSQQLLNRKELKALLYALAGWAFFYLPWIKIGRVLFLYHYFASYLFALLLTGFWLGQAFKSRLSGFVSVLILIAALAVSLFFLPIWTAYPIPQVWFNHLMWFKSWI